MGPNESDVLKRVNHDYQNPYQAPEDMDIESDHENSENDSFTVKKEEITSKKNKKAKKLAKKAKKEQKKKDKKHKKASKRLKSEENIDSEVESEEEDSYAMDFTTRLGAFLNNDNVSDSNSSKMSVTSESIATPLDQPNFAADSDN